MWQRDTCTEVLAGRPSESRRIHVVRGQGQPLIRSRPRRDGTLIRKPSTAMMKTLDTVGADCQGILGPTQTGRIASTAERTRGEKQDDDGAHD